MTRFSRDERGVALLVTLLVLVLATAAAGAQAQVQQNRSAAAQAMMNAGFQGVQGAQQAQAAQIQYANAPMDLYNKYASVVYGIPQQGTTPNFAGTQGQQQRSKGFGF